METRRTIFALSTARGRAAVAIIRISGPSAGLALTALGAGRPDPRRATLALLRDPTTGEPLDRALCLWFPGPASYTGEDLAELQIHGGPAIIEGVLKALAALPDFAPAERGEFTRRAFVNGRLDLTAAEGIGDLIEAETAAQRRLALKAADGALAALVEAWRGALIRGMALLEADIDFPDEGLVGNLPAQARAPLVALERALARQLDQSQRAERLRQGFQVALLGAPNVGKSSLLNALARREVAIVSDQPGTTRDILEVHLDLGGYPVTVADMAGLREGGDTIESIGIARAEKRAKESDLRLLLMEATEPPFPLPDSLARFRAPQDIVVLTKVDLLSSGGPEPGPRSIPVSAYTGAGLGALLRQIEVSAIDALGAADAPQFTRLRHRQALQDARTALVRALAQWDGAPPEILAEDLRLAGRALGRLTGLIDVEDLLDTIFSEFCIGK